MEKKMLNVKFSVRKGNLAIYQNVRTRACASSNEALRRRVFACVNGRPRPVNSPAEPACSRRSPVAEPNTARRQKRVESPRRRLHPVLLFSTLSLLSLLFRDSLPTPSVPLLPLTFFFLPLPRVTWVVVTSPSDRRPQVCPPVTGAKEGGGAANLCVREAEREKGRGGDSGLQVEFHVRAHGRIDARAPSITRRDISTTKRLQSNGPINLI